MSPSSREASAGPHRGGAQAPADESGPAESGAEQKPGRDFGSESANADKSADTQSPAPRESVDQQVNTGLAQPAAGPVRAAPQPAREPDGEISVPATTVAVIPVTRVAAPPVSTEVRRRVLSVRAATVPIAPPGAPGAPTAEAVMGALSLARRDLELQQMYGDPSRNARYYVTQTSGNCVLMASAMVIGQLTGRTPTERQIVFEAMRTPSDVLPGKMMYWGLKNQMRWAYYKDAQKLLQNHGITSTITQYQGEPDTAMDALKTALSDPNKATMVAIEADTIWNAVMYGKGFVPPAPGTRSNHAIVVIGVDTATNTVYVNDSSASQINPATGRPWGQNMAVPMEVFMAAWGTSDHLTVVGELTAEPAAPTTWLAISPRRDTVDPAKDAHLAHFRNN